MKRPIHPAKRKLWVYMPGDEIMLGSPLSLPTHVFVFYCRGDKSLAVIKPLEGGSPLRVAVDRIYPKSA